MYKERFDAIFLYTGREVSSPYLNRMINNLL